jgi:hypothetical protein
MGWEHAEGVRKTMVGINEIMESPITTGVLINLIFIMKWFFESLEKRWWFT